MSAFILFCLICIFVTMTFHHPNFHFEIFWDEQVDWDHYSPADYPTQEDWSFYPHVPVYSESAPYFIALPIPFILCYFLSQLILFFRFLKLDEKSPKKPKNLFLLLLSILAFFPLFFFYIDYENSFVLNGHVVDYTDLDFQMPLFTFYLFVIILFGFFIYLLKLLTKDSELKKQRTEHEESAEKNIKTGKITKAFLVLITALVIGAPAINIIEEICLESIRKHTNTLNGKLYWSKKAPKRMTWNEAATYCNTLEENGYSDWELPSINKLRSLIQNCPATQAGSECKIADNCLSGKECWSDTCKGCTQNDSGKYSIFSDTGWFWSSSETNWYTTKWGVNFSFGYVDSGYELNYGYVRCVRNAK